VWREVINLLPAMRSWVSCGRYILREVWSYIKRTKRIPSCRLFCTPILHSQIPCWQNPHHPQFNRRRTETGNGFLCWCGQLHIHIWKVGSRGSPSDHGWLLQDPNGWDTQVGRDYQPVHRWWCNGFIWCSCCSWRSCAEGLLCSAGHSKSYGGIWR